MPNTKPMGAYSLFVTTGTGTFPANTPFAVTNIIKHSKVTFGGQAPANEELEVNLPHRGDYYNIEGALNDVSFSIETPFYGVGTAGTASVPKKALMEAAGMSETVTGGTSVVYESDDDNPTSFMSLYRVDRLGLIGEYIDGAIVDTMALEFTKDSFPKITYSGVGARKFGFCKTSLGAALTDIATTMTLNNPKAVLAGISDAELTGLAIVATIGTEHVIITAANRTTGVCTITRAALGSSAAAHDDDSPVSPYNSGGTKQEAGVLVGSQNWAATINTVAYGVRKITFNLKTGRAFDDRDDRALYANGHHNGPLRGDGSFSMILNVSDTNGRSDLLTAIEQSTNLVISIVAGATAGSISTISLPLCKLLEPVPTDLDTAKPTEIELKFKTKDLETALGGQITITDT